MGNHNKTGRITIVGIDLAKNVFHLHGIDASGDVVGRWQGAPASMPP